MLATRKQTTGSLGGPLGPSPDSSGVIYIGTRSDTGEREGKGVMRWPDGAKYDGEWVAGCMEGHGSFFFPAGDVYVGNFRRNKKHGDGSYQHAGGDRYTGEFRDDAEHGYGTYVWADGASYAGLWKHGQMHGYGVVIHTNGDVYEGWHFAALRHGRGRLRCPDGTAYVGEWTRGRREGMGTLLLHGGDGYNGFWRDDVMHGDGTWFHSDGRRETGEWYYGALNGVRFETPTMAQEAAVAAPSAPPPPAASPPRDSSPPRTKLWWTELIGGEEHLRKGWAREGIRELQQECATEHPVPAAPPAAAEGADDGAAALDAAAARYAMENAGTPFRQCPGPPERPPAREAYQRLCAAKGLRANAAVSAGIDPELTTHQLTCIDCSGTYLGDKGSAMVIHFLAACPNVTRLILCDAHLGQGVLHLLADEGARHPRLRSVDLRGNFIEHPAAKALHRMLCLNSNIEHLHLQGCQVNTGLCKQITERLRYNTRVNENLIHTAAIP
eukprot:TRINITY_DN69927_c0_g1_i1.p1 TRINITY_DN69927_c0_g1~~TRINITY_DN69927_c0_g1_i1.p1  ORF type:complete len:525 (+),score=166.77 TRINITY_DN69927_c0_g1_i1:85-1575(+)